LLRGVHETAGDLTALQAVIDASYAAAGPHLLSSHDPERRLSAEQVSEQLTGMSLLALATVTRDCRPIVGPVDGIFFRGAFYFGSAANSVRFRHIRARPQVSATHLRGEELAVTVHGRATPIDIGAPEHAAFRRAVLDVYVPIYGEGWEQEFLEAVSPMYARIDAERMFTFYMPAS
jgi:uncharacterized pyridoxamine 5'-phosphate oxidase family protein